MCCMLWHKHMHLPIWWRPLGLTQPLAMSTCASGCCGCITLRALLPRSAPATWLSRPACCHAMKSARVDPHTLMAGVCVSLVSTSTDHVRDARASHAELAVQGLVESRPLKDREDRPYTLCLLARRSRLHPGMRYIARGLNALASPGNEIECDQVLLPAISVCRLMAMRKGAVWVA